MYVSNWKFVDSNGNLCEARYVPSMDVFNVRYVGQLSVFVYDAEEVEDYLNRGIWKRIS
jgi:hypothetical protein